MKLEKCKIGMDKPILPRLLFALMALAWNEAGVLVICQVE